MPIVTRPHQFPALDGVHHREILANGMRFHLAEAGSGQPVLLLHSFPQHWYAWRHVIPRLASDYRLLCLDLRGAGWSDAPATGYDTDTLVADVLAVLDALRLPRVRLIAHGMGASIGFRLCQQAGDRISHFLALNTVPPWRGPHSTRRHAWRLWHTALWEYPLLGRLVLRRLPVVTRALLRHWSTTPWTADDLAIFVEPSHEPARAHAGQQLHWQFVLREIPRLRRGPGPRLTVPTRLLGGSSDVVIAPAMLRGLEHHGDDFEIRVVPGGHLLPEDAPDLVAAAARSLFGQVSRV